MSQSAPKTRLMFPYRLSTMLYLNLRLVVSLFILLIFSMSAAQAASCKVPKSYYKNVSCTSHSGYFLAIKDFGAPVALIDKNGKVVIDLLRYQQVDTDKMASGLIPVLRNSHVGYINMQGREVIPPIYDRVSGGKNWARAVSEGRIVVKRGAEYGVIDTNNQMIVPFSAGITDIEDYRGGRAKIRKNNSSGWLDKNGNSIKDTKDSLPKNSAANNSSTKNSSAKTDSLTQNSPKAPAPLPKPAATFTTLQASQQDGKWGFVDEQNVIMITYSFDEVRPFSEGLAAVRIADKWGFLNLGGELVIAFDFDDFKPNDSAEDTDSIDNTDKRSAFIFNNGKAWVSVADNGDKLCIDKTGQPIGCD